MSASTSGDTGQVVEFLTFVIPEGELEGWLAADEQHWTYFLERQPGFLRKERWIGAHDPGHVHLAIWWRSRSDWESVPADELVAVGRAMGAWERTPTCVSFDVLA